MQDMLLTCSPRSWNLWMISGNRITLISVVLLAGFLGALLFLIRTTHQHDSRINFSDLANKDSITERNARSDSLSNIRPSYSTRSETEDESALDHTEAPGEQRPPGRRLAQAKSAFEAEEVLEDIALTDPEVALEQLRELNNFCHSNSFSHSSDAVKAKRAEFCQDFPAIHDERSSNEIAESIIGSSSLELEVISEETLRLTPQKDRSDRFSEMVISTRFAMQIDLLIGVNVRWKMESGEFLWKMGEELAKERYPEADLLNAQTVALHLYRCARFGGCGANDHFTALFCEFELGGRCARDSTVQDMLFKTTPPVEFNLAHEILGKLAAFR